MQVSWEDWLLLGFDPSSPDWIYAKRYISTEGISEQRG